MTRRRKSIWLARAVLVALAAWWTGLIPVAAWPAVAMALAHAPLGFFWTHCPCCEECCACEHCEEGCGPAEYELIIAGVENDLCEECSSLNGTYILDCRIPCLWQYGLAEPDPPELGCGVYGWSLVLNSTSTPPRFEVHGLSDEAVEFLFEWRHEIDDTPFDCQSLVSESFELVSNGAAQCGGTPTATVTAL